MREQSQKRRKITKMDQDDEKGMFLTTQETAEIMFGEEATQTTYYRNAVLRLCKENQLKYFTVGRRKFIDGNQFLE